MAHTQTKSELNAIEALELVEHHVSTLFSQPRSARPSGKTMVEALLTLEKAAKSRRQHYPLESLMGEWQLYFTTSGKIRPTDQRRTGFYWPQVFPAQISFSPNTEAIAPANPPLCIQNQIRCGQLALTLSGFARYLEPKNLLAFDFAQIECTLFGKTLYKGRFPSQTTTDNFMEKSIGKLAFFSFFTMRDRWIAARGKGGGLAIWIKNTESTP